MRTQQFKISDTITHFYFDASFEDLKQMAPVENSFIITDENIMLHYEKLLKPWKVICIPAGEASKNIGVLDDIVRQLIALDADRDATIIGMGGGVVTDIAGFVAGIYKRGVKCGFVPTSVLAMVDASLGGKNGLDIGEYKNMIGLIRQPNFILYDYKLLKTLPKAEWINGFAEIIKHACILNADMFTFLQRHFIADFQRDEGLLATLIEQNVLLKMTVVQEDEMEWGIRKFLNFGHTLGHAIENVYDLPHGHAVSIGMVFAARVSKILLGFEQEEELLQLLGKYQLPTTFDFNTKNALSVMQKDKKKLGDTISYVLLQQLGMATVKPLTLNEIENYLSLYMEVKLTASKVKGIAQAPASKSVMQRACAAALLRNGTTVIHNYGTSNDDKSALGIIQQMGASVSYLSEEVLEIHAEGWPKASKETVINCGESGLSFRMFAPLAALMDVPVMIDGHGSLLKRPVQFLQTVLSDLEVHVKTETGGLPMQIHGPLKSKDYTLDGGLTSQLLTGLLFSYAASLEEDVTIKVDNLKSRPYIDLTLKVMEDFGMNVPTHLNYESFNFKHKEKKVSPDVSFHYTVEGDWSNAAFLMVAGAIAGSVTIKGLDVFSTQADKKILEALQDCGCRLSIQMEQIEVHKHQLKAFHFDATDCPDLFPPLVALAAFCEGTSVIEGVHRLEHKESNRTESLKAEFAKIGVSIQVQDDNMIIAKDSMLEHSNVFDGHNDHRIVMAMAIAALALENDSIVEGAEAVNKSFPDFFETLEQIKIK